MPQPFELISGPFEVYLAPVGEAFPAIDAAPAGNWTLIGSGGSRNYDSEGVTIEHGETIEYYRPLGTPAPVKGFRTEEDLMIRFTLNDLTLEQYRRTLNENAVTTNAGPPANKEIDIAKGKDVAQRALLVRGDSPYGATWNLQYEVPVVVEEGTPEVVAQKGGPAGLALVYRALRDPSAASEAKIFGVLRAQHA